MKHFLCMVIVALLIGCPGGYHGGTGGAGGTADCGVSPVISTE